MAKAASNIAPASETLSQKERAAEWFRNLRDQICSAFEALEDELKGTEFVSMEPGRFERKPIAADNSWKGFYKDKKILNALGKMFNSI